jgi:uncharacterized membrane protein YkoI
MTKQRLFPSLAGLSVLGVVAVVQGGGRIALDQLPVAAREALIQLAGGATITEVEQENKHGMALYEAEWKVNGHEAEAVVTADGHLVEMEEEIDASALPPNVAAVVAQQFPGATNIEYEKVMVTVYEIEAKINGVEKEIQVLATGKIIGQEEEDDDGADDDDN